MGTYGYPFSRIGARKHRHLLITGDATSTPLYWPPLQAWLHLDILAMNTTNTDGDKTYTCCSVTPALKGFNFTITLVPYISCKKESVCRSTATSIQQCG